MNVSWDWFPFILHYQFFLVQNFLEAQGFASSLGACISPFNESFQQMEINSLLRSTKIQLEKIRKRGGM
jgi:hypothetical protein